MNYLGGDECAEKGKEGSAGGDVAFWKRSVLRIDGISAGETA